MRLLSLSLLAGLLLLLVPAVAYAQEVALSTDYSVNEDERGQLFSEVQEDLWPWLLQGFKVGPVMYKYRCPCFISY
jgi:hypothetical protein